MAAKDAPSGNGNLLFELHYVKTDAKPSPCYCIRPSDASIKAEYGWKVPEGKKKTQ